MSAIPNRTRQTISMIMCHLIRLGIFARKTNQFKTFWKKSTKSYRAASRFIAIFSFPQEFKPACLSIRTVNMNMQIYIFKFYKQYNWGLTILNYKHHLPAIYFKLPPFFNLEELVLRLFATQTWIWCPVPHGERSKPSAKVLSRWTIKAELDLVSLIFWLTVRFYNLSIS